MNRIDRLFAVRVPCYNCGKVVLVSLEGRNHTRGRLSHGCVQQVSARCAL
jgi:hypothetical protein